MSGVNTLTFTDATWDAEVLNSEVPVLVDFWAEWCGPCRMMSPTVDAVADAYVGRAKVGKLNVDDNGATGMRYNVRGIPTLLLFKGGKVVEQKVGAVGKADVQKMLDGHVGAEVVPISGKPAAAEVKAEPAAADLKAVRS
ncbi:MAG TPA: thioredoxin [Bryobacteraceae bacterium]|jgi:thioredoxin 1|nr:thioredoxin [Bryobacteraceae bacterium]